MLRLFVVFLGATIVAGSACAAVTQLTDVPAYIWYNGCGPTACGMIVGYWDAHGFPNLIAGSNSWDSNQTEVKAMIASPGHIRDYVPTPDRVATTADPYHADDCVADFMWCSRAPICDSYGYSWTSMQDNGLRDYAAYRGYHNATSYYRSSMDDLWQDFVASIDAGRPVEFTVDSNGDGDEDHFVTAIGYDDTSGAEKYACLNTWDRVVHWYAYRNVGMGSNWGVGYGTLFDPGPPNGDANRDGIVDMKDYVTWFANYGQTGATWDQGDFSGDGTVDMSDYVTWFENFGLSRNDVAPVPEPATMTVLLFGALTLRGPSRHAHCHRHELRPEHVD
ncbi:MAG: hypothetical protein ACE15C_01755 [Phycisphaerae bacterium]